MLFSSRVGIRAQCRAVAVAIASVWPIAAHAADAPAAAPEGKIQAQAQAQAQPEARTADAAPRATSNAETTPSPTVAKPEHSRASSTPADASAAELDTDDEDLDEAADESDPKSTRSKSGTSADSARNGDDDGASDSSGPPAPSPRERLRGRRSARSENASDADSDSVYTSRGLLGPLRLGATTGFGLPDGVRVGAYAKLSGIVAVGGAFSTIPEMNLPGLPASIARATGEGFLRLHPFRGAFYAGVSGGYTQTKGGVSETREAFNNPHTFLARGYANATFVAPHLGFQWMLPFGLTLGCDAGLEIPIRQPSPPTT